MLKLGLTPVTGINRVTLKRTGNVRVYPVAFAAVTSIDEM